MRLQGALDNDILIATRKFLSDGVPADVDSLWTAISRSNSSLKRKPKKVLRASLERVLEFIGVDNRASSPDSEAALDEKQETDTAAEVMNLSLIHI